MERDAQKNIETLQGLSALTDATHDELADLTTDLETMHQIPDFWIDGRPAWFAETDNKEVHSYWPIVARKNGKVAIKSADKLRTIWFAEQDFCEKLSNDAQINLTKAEQSLLVDLAMGLNLHQSANETGVAVSTRRKQLQGLFKKYGVKNQVELVAKAADQIQQLSSLVATSFLPLSSDAATNQLVVQGYRKHLPNGARIGVIAGPDGDPVRYFEFGPVHGRPVMILHSMVFPNIEDVDVQLFNKLGWRTIWPIRPGCLESTTNRNQKWQSHCDKVVEDMNVLLNAVTDRPVPVVSLVSSAAYAVSLAERHPDLVHSIEFVATCFSSGKDGPQDYFFDRMVHKLVNNGRLAGIALAHLAHGLSNRAQLEITTRRIFRESKVDQAQLDGEFGSPERSERFYMASLNSLDSMRQDYFSQLNFSWLRLRHMPQTTRFWHGTDDCVNNLDQVTKLAMNVTGERPEVLSGLGHLTQGAPMRAAYQAIAQKLF